MSHALIYMHRVMLVRMHSAICDNGTFKSNQKILEVTYDADIQ